MRILVALTYYRPYTSGLTLYAERLALALLKRGHQVSVLTSRYDGHLPKQEVLDGVQVQRLKVALRVSKGPVMPALPLAGWRAVRQAEVVNLHLPQLDAAMLAVFAWILGKRLVATYHCDLLLPAGPVNRLANWVVNLANHVSASLAQVIVTNTRDYAENSPFLRHYMAKVHQIYPPAMVTPPSEADRQAIHQKARIKPGEILIGMAARLASEKGVEYLLEALPMVQQKYPQARVIFVGPYQNIPGEEAYARRLAPQIARLGESWQFLGLLEAGEFAAFLEVCQVTVLPSLNSTESFGMVQVESMLCGTPVIATDLPGVRQPVALTGMGRVIPAQDARLLAEAILALLDGGQKQPGMQADLQRMFSVEEVARQYEALMQGDA